MKTNSTPNSILFPQFPRLVFAFTYFIRICKNKIVRISFRPLSNYKGYAFIPCSGLNFLITFVFLLLTSIVHGQTITPADNGLSISADNALSGTYITLTGPVFTEISTGNFGTGTIILNAPNGFMFDISGIAPTVIISKVSGGNCQNCGNINNVTATTSLPSTPQSTTRTSNQITFQITSTSGQNVRNSLTWQNIRVKPTAGTPLASGNITKTGSSSTGTATSTANFGTLTEVSGNATKLVITQQPSSTTYGSSIGNAIVRTQDQFGNYTSTNLGSNLSVTASIASGTGNLINNIQNIGSAGGNGTVTFSNLQATTVGLKTITFSAQGLPSVTSSSVQVSPKVINITSASGQNKVYDQTNAAVITGILSGVVGTDMVTINGTGTFATVNVGNTIAVTSTSTLAGANAGNYTLTQPINLTANITPRPLTITGISMVSRVYNGTTVATIIGTPSLNGVISGDVVTLNSSGATATFANKTVESNKNVSLNGYSISGTNAGNYTLTQPSGLTANITALALTGTITAANKIYDGNGNATIASRNLTGAITGDDVSYSGGTATFIDKNVGTGKLVSGTSFGLTGTDAANYTVNTNATTTASITAKLLTISATGINKVYDGTNAATVTLTTDKLSADALTVSYTAAAFADKNVGTGKAVSVSGISISGTDAGNYTFNTTANIIASIIPKGITGSFTAKNKAYDGTTTAEVIARNPAGVIVGDDVRLDGGTADFDTPTTGLNKRVTLTGATLVGTNATNYTLTSVATTTANIINDNDKDGIADANDLDNDNDGILDTIESTTEDKDKDGIVNSFDLDSDGDGIPDTIEQTTDGKTAPSDYIYPTSRFVTVDVNGVPTQSSTVNSGFDLDKDGLPNFLDLDSDNDGLSDNLEAQPIPTSPATTRRPQGTDSDKDGIDNQYDPSCGCSTNGVTNDPVISGIISFLPDYLNKDSDNDGQPDYVEAFNLNRDVNNIAIDDLKELANKFVPAGRYVNTVDTDNDNVPDWLENSTNKIPNYLDYTTRTIYYYDSDNDGWIDLFDAATFNDELTPNYAIRNNSDIVTLPVQIIHLKATSDKYKVHLTWQTASEHDNRYFTVERSSNGIYFEAIGQIEGAGNSNQLLNYSFTDTKPLNDVSYYRLKQINYNNKSSSAAMVAVQRETPQSGAELLAYPNPTPDAFTLKFLASQSEKITIEIKNLVGKFYLTKAVDTIEGLNSETLNLADAPNGTYLVLVKGSHINLAQRIVKLR